MASVRFICGTHATHKALEQRLARFLGSEDVILYSSCFDANGGLFETLLDERDAVISDALNHASIIDGIRLCKAQRHRYANKRHGGARAMPQTGAGRAHAPHRHRRVFSMDGFIARLGEICDLAARYEALVMVDDSHATGSWSHRPGYARTLRRRRARRHSHRHTRQGPGGRQRRLRCRAPRSHRVACGSVRAHTCSPTAFAGGWAAASLAVLELLEHTPQLRAQLSRTRACSAPGSPRPAFDLKPGEHPIIPVMLGDAALRRPHGRPAAWSAACTSSASPIRSCPKGRRASARRCPRR